MKRNLDFIEDGKADITRTLSWIISGIIEAFFIAVWILTQWLVSKYVVSQFEVDGIDKLVLHIAQWLFAALTLIPLLKETFTKLETLFGEMIDIIGRLLVRYRRMSKEVERHK